MWDQKNQGGKILMRINHNIAALNTYRQLTAATNAQSKSMEKLSSGLRINRAGDDAAGLAISEKMRGQIRGLDQAARNAQDGISLIQTAEGALNETHSILQRMRELAVQSANDTSTLDDRKEIQKEINQLIEEIDRIGDNTEFNTQKLLDGSLSSTGVKFHIGANENQNITLRINSMKTDSIGSTAATGGANATSATSITTDFSGSGNDSKITITGGTTNNTVTIILNQDYGSAAEVVKEINSQISSDADMAGHVEAKLLDDGKITFIAKDSDETYTLSDGTGSVNASTSLKIASLGAISNSPSYVSSLEVSNVDTATSGGVLTQSGANSAITVIDDAIKMVSAERSKLGAYQNRLEHTINNLGTSSENLTAAESRIRDVDYALAA